MSLTRNRVFNETLYLLLDLPIGVAGFTAVVTALAVALSMSITLVGIPLLTATLLAARYAGRAERARARALLGYELPAPQPLPREKTVLTRLFAPIRNGAAWRATTYFALMLPAGIVTFTVAVTWWATSLALLTSPAWGWTQEHWNRPYQLALSAIAGLGMTLAAPAVMHGLTALDRRLLRLLGR
jgi:hypothetical protein